MEDLSTHKEVLSAAMPHPMGSLFESIIESDFSLRSLEVSEGFREQHLQSAVDQIFSEVKVWLKQIPDMPELETGVRIGEIFGEVHPHSLFYLVDENFKKINLFFFKPTTSVMPILEIMSAAAPVARVDSEMFEGLKRGEAGIDPEAVKGLARMLIDSIPERMNPFSMAIKNQDWQVMVAQAHYLKSSFGVMGLDRLSWLVARLEIAAKRKELVKTQAYYQILYPELTLAVRFLQKAFPE
jgi:HPt (histidine-containing phosphotransfer) domain-containing protein